MLSSQIRIRSHVLLRAPKLGYTIFFTIKLKIKLMQLALVNAWAPQILLLRMLRLVILFCNMRVKLFPIILVCSICFQPCRKMVMARCHICLGLPGQAQSTNSGSNTDSSSSSTPSRLCLVTTHTVFPPYENQTDLK